MFREIRLYFFFVGTFWFSYHLWLQVFRLVTVYRPPPSKKNGFTVERFFSEFSALSEELTVTFCQFLLCGDFNFHVDVDSNANAKQFCDLFFRLICHPLCELIGTTPWNCSQRCEKAVYAVKYALTWAAAVLAHFDPEYPVELSVYAIPYGLDAVITARLSQWKPLLHCLRVTNSERTRQSIQLQHQICSIEAKFSSWCVIAAALALRV